MSVEYDLYYMLAAVAVFGAAVGFILSLRMVDRERVQSMRRRLRKRVGIISAIDFDAIENAKCVWCDIGMALAPSKPEELKAARIKLAFAGYRKKEHLAAFFLVKFGGALLLGAGGIVALIWNLLDMAQEQGFCTLSREDKNGTWHILIAKSRTITLEEYLCV
jgi:hypothetical protein